MTATAHALIGTVIAAKIGNPYAAIPIALVSHVLADSVPHWDTVTNGKAKGDVRKFIDSAIDVVLSFVLSYFVLSWLFPSTPLDYAFLIIIAAQAFDWLTLPYYFFDIKFFKPFYKFQKLFDKKLDKPWGIVTQVVVVIGMLIIGTIL